MRNRGADNTLEIIEESGSDKLIDGGTKERISELEIA